MVIVCPNCKSEYGYPDVTGYSCPECGNHWTDADLEAMKIRDSVGNELNDGDDVILVRDLKLGKDTLKKGTRARNIKLLENLVDGHDMEGRVEGHSTIYLKSSVVKKA